MKMESMYSEEIQLNFFDFLSSPDATVSQAPEPQNDLSGDAVYVNHVNDDHISADLMEWSLESVINLKESLLMTSLHQMGDRKTGLDTRIEIRAWMECTEIGGFSFIECCNTVGVNPDELRDECESLFETLRG